MEKDYDVIKMIKPNEAKGEVKEIYDDIIKTKGQRWLVPLWGLFAHRPKLLKLWWELTKTLQIEKGKVDKSLMNSISLVSAVAADCARCVDNHQIMLIEKLGFSEEKVEQIRLLVENRSECQLPEIEKAVLTFALKVGLGQEVGEEDFRKLRELGFGDEELVEIISISLLESGFSRHAVSTARFEDGFSWPREYTPSEFYSKNVDR
jgi:alkylhydroperoxidase family enzyme